MKNQLLLLAMALLPMVAWGKVVKIGKVWYDYDYDKETAEVVAPPSEDEKYEGDIEILSFFKYDEGEGEAYTVTSIGERAFANCTGLTSITIPNSIKSIAYKAFRGCSSLTSLNIEGVTTIGESAFENCTGLTVVKLSNDLTSIGNYVFAGCIKLTTIDIPKSTKTIGSYAFSSSGLTSIEIPDNVSAISYYAFHSCIALTSIILKGAPYVGQNAFSYCSKLESFTIESTSFVSVFDDTFSGSNIKNATLHVPYGKKTAYENANGWKDFKEIVEALPLKCATPTIVANKGVISFTCATEGVKFVYSYPSLAIENVGNNIKFPSKVQISVYATKDGYENSEKATAEIDPQGLKGDVNQDGVVSITDAVSVVNIILAGGSE